MFYVLAMFLKSVFFVEIWSILLTIILSNTKVSVPFYIIVVTGIGQQGDVVCVNKSVAYNELLLPGLADYVTPENIQYWSSAKKETVKEILFSSPLVEMVR